MPIATRSFLALLLALRTEGTEPRAPLTNTAKYGTDNSRSSSASNSVDPMLCHRVTFCCHVTPPARPLGAGPSHTVASCINMDCAYGGQVESMQQPTLDMHRLIQGSIYESFVREGVPGGRCAVGRRPKAHSTAGEFGHRRHTNRAGI